MRKPIENSRDFCAATMRRFKLDRKSARKKPRNIAGEAIPTFKINDDSFADRGGKELRTAMKWGDIPIVWQGCSRPSRFMRRP